MRTFIRLDSWLSPVSSNAVELRSKDSTEICVTALPASGNVRIRKFSTTESFQNLADFLKENLLAFFLNPLQGLIHSKHDWISLLKGHTFHKIPGQSISSHTHPDGVEPQEADTASTTDGCYMNDSVPKVILTVTARKIHIMVAHLPKEPSSEVLLGVLDTESPKMRAHWLTQILANNTFSPEDKAHLTAMLPSVDTL